MSSVGTVISASSVEHNSGHHTFAPDQTNHRHVNVTTAKPSAVMHSSTSSGFIGLSSTTELDDTCLLSEWVIDPGLNLPLFPMPEKEFLCSCVREIVNNPPRTPPGPAQTALRKICLEWFHQVHRQIRGDSILVTGALELNMPLWSSHLASIDPTHRKRVLRRITHGVEFPWIGGAPPLKPLRTWRNGPSLSLNASRLWRTLEEQLNEGAVIAWDVRARGLPMGMSPIKCVNKTGSDKVRVVIALCDVNDNFIPEASKCSLQMLHSVRAVWEVDDWQVSDDEHNSFFHLKLCDRDLTWAGFSLHPSELPPGVSDEVLKRFGSHCLHKPSGRLIFALAGMPQGAAPSTAFMDDLSSAVVQGFRSCRHGSQVPRSLHYVDDFNHLIRSPKVRGHVHSLCRRGRDLLRGFVDALTFHANFIVRLLRLGFTFNVVKTRFVPHLHRVHLGLLCSSPDLKFRETRRGAVKLTVARDSLRSAVSRSSRVSAKLIAKFLGSLWSRRLLMHRAVPIMTRGMVEVLARRLRLDLQPWAASKERCVRRFVSIIKHSWSGSVAWDDEADEDLQFWEGVDFLTQEAPMNFDAAEESLKTFVCTPNSVDIMPGVRFFAADTSESASGAAEFLPGQGGTFHMARSTSIPLAPGENDLYSTLRELLGCLRMDLALIPDEVKLVVLLCDSESTVRVLLRSSSHREMARLVKAFFLRCLRLGRIVFPLWVRRTFAPIVSVDTLSRFVDKHDFHVTSEIFWRANKVAVQCWGIGFQVDRAASWVNAMPIDLLTRLPFNSRSYSPHSSGVDMFKQNWRRLVNWCNPPFALLGRVLRLIRTQQVRAAVVFPARSCSWWSADARQGADGVVHILTFRSPMLRSDGSGPLRARPCNIVFFDFAPLGSTLDRNVPAAEALPLQLLPPPTVKPTSIVHTTLPPTYCGAVINALNRSQEGSPSLHLR